MILSCHSTENKILLPDLRPSFLQTLKKSDSTVDLDSFFFIGIDTMTEKKALIHQRFSFTHIMDRINTELIRTSRNADSFHSIPSAKNIEMIEYLNGEKMYVGKEIDSFNRLITHADSISPVGYRAFYKVTVSKKDRFRVSDTIAYAINLKMKISDWDRRIEKNVDSLVVGKKNHAGGGLH